MSTLVAYASKHGATQGIAERIATTLKAAGHEAEARPVEAVDDLTGYDAFVVGSAVYGTNSSPTTASPPPAPTTAPCRRTSTPSSPAPVPSSAATARKTVHCEERPPNSTGR